MKAQKMSSLMHKVGRQLLQPVGTSWTRCKELLKGMKRLSLYCSCDLYLYCHRGRGHREGHEVSGKPPHLSLGSKSGLRAWKESVVLLNRNR